jgi:hypothetical protein
MARSRISVAVPSLEIDRRGGGKAWYGGRDITSPEKMGGLGTHFQKISHRVGRNIGLLKRTAEAATAMADR